MLVAGVKNSKMILEHGKPFTVNISSTKIFNIKYKFISCQRFLSHDKAIKVVTRQFYIKIFVFALKIRIAFHN